MKPKKISKHYRISVETVSTLIVLSELTGEDMTKLLEDCVRIGKKTVAKTRLLDYNDLIMRIKYKKAALLQGSKMEQYDPKLNNNNNLTDQEIEESIKLAKTRWIDD